MIDYNDAAHRLLMWYARNFETRRLPWRQYGEARTRVALVEGLLAQTQAGAVAQAYWNIFEGILHPEDWLGLSTEERLFRVAQLGLPAQKESAVTGIAQVLSAGSAVDRSPMCAQLVKARGIGPYTAAMVALLHGEPAAPVDCNIKRVARRHVGWPVDNPEGWSLNLVTNAMKLTSVAGWPPAYEAISAVMDVGARICTPKLRDCYRCPLRHSCKTFERDGAQEMLPFPEEPDGVAYKTARVSDTPVVEIGIGVPVSSTINMERYAEDVEGMLSVYSRTEAEKIARLVVGYLGSELRDARIWCRVQKEGEVGITAWN